MIKPSPQIVMEHGRLKVDCKKCQLFELRTPLKPIEKFPFEVCPRCDRAVLGHMKFCCICGQKLDWGGEG